MTVRAKFKVSSITIHEGGTRSIEMSAVTSGSDENKAFWRWTPAGTLKMDCLNPEASAQFEVGKEYYLDITLAEG